MTNELVLEPYVKEILEKFARTKLPILLLGPTGSGKSALAARIHQMSERSGPYVARNCSETPKDLIAGELLGTVRGAFTGAMDRHGWVKIADRGTLFLDEIGELPLEAQPKFLSVIEGQPFFRIGDAMTPLRSDVRVLAATLQDLNGLMEQGKFREDLYQRLNWIVIRLPMLRDRTDRMDIAQALVQKACARNPNDATNILRRIERLFDLPDSWPGNIRELMAFVQIAVIDSDFADSRTQNEWARRTNPRSATTTHIPTRSVSQTLDDIEQFAALIRGGLPASTNPNARPPMFRSQEGSRALARLLLAKDPPGPVSRSEIQTVLGLNDGRPVANILVELARDGLIVHQGQSIAAIWPQAKVSLSRRMTLPGGITGFLPVSPDESLVAKTGDKLRIQVRSPAQRFVTVGIVTHSWDKVAPDRAERREPTLLVRRKKLEANAASMDLDFDLVPPCGCVQVLVHLSPAEHWGARLAEYSEVPNLVPTSLLEVVRRRVLQPRDGGGWGDGWLTEFVIVQSDGESESVEEQGHRE